MTQVRIINNAIITVKHNCRIMVAGQEMKIFASEKSIISAPLHVINPLYLTWVFEWLIDCFVDSDQAFCIVSKTMM